MVTGKTTSNNQNGKIVITLKRTFMVYKRGHAPEIARLTPEEET
jgi:itaconyl-CoA hydratase